MLTFSVGERSNFAQKRRRPEQGHFGSWIYADQGSR
jgi:hypothetical protein